MRPVLAFPLRCARARTYRSHPHPPSRPTTPPRNRSYDDITFELLLGSGSFGDAYKGLWRGSTAVAVKKMRAGLIDEDGFGSFIREVEMLAKLNHKHVIGFIGYALRPGMLRRSERGDRC